MAVNLRSNRPMMSRPTVYDVTPLHLAYGPPGCGKTELAKWLSAKLEVPLITARIDLLVSSYLGSTSKNLRSLFGVRPVARAYCF